MVRSWSVSSSSSSLWFGVVVCVMTTWCWSELVEGQQQRTGHLYPKVDERRRRLEESTPEMDSPEYWEQMDMVMEGASIADQFVEFEQTVDDLTLICEGEVTMFRLVCPVDTCDDGVGGSGCDTSRCRASFCQVDWDLPRRDPGRYPAFVDLVGASAHCDSSPITVDLRQVVRACRDYDQQPPPPHDEEGEPQLPHLLSLGGLVTELGYTDAGFMAHAVMGGGGSDLHHHNRVLVDPQPVLEAMTMCDDYRKRRQRTLQHIDTTCDRAEVAALLRDVVDLYRRSRDPHEQQLYLKVAPAAVLGLDVWEQAFPDQPWIFVYDEPGAALGAQFEPGRIKPERAACVATRKDPPEGVQRVVRRRHADRAYQDLTTAEYCAAYLAFLADAAYDRAQHSQRGTLVRSDQVLDTLRDILAQRFDVTTEASSLFLPKDNLALAKEYYQREGLDLQTALREKKLAKVTEELTAASNEYYRDVFERMEQFQQPQTDSSFGNVFDKMITYQAHELP